MNRGIYRKPGLLAAALVIFAVAVLLQYSSFNSINEKSRVRRFEKAFQSKEHHLYSVFSEMESVLQNSEEIDYFRIFSGSDNDGQDTYGIQLFAYEGDKLVYWSGNKIPVSDYFPAELDSLPPVEDELKFLGNSWSVVKQRQIGSTRLYGLIKIKNEFSYENIFLKNEYETGFSLPAECKIIPGTGHGAYPIEDSWGNVLFELDFSEVPKYSRFQSHLSLVLYYLGIFLFLLYVRHLVRSIQDRKMKNAGILMGAVILILLNAVLLKLPVPAQMRSMEIFNPVLFAASNIFPSLADLLTTSFFVFFLAYIFYNEFNLGDKHKGRVFQVLQMVFFLALVFYIQLVLMLFRSLVINSSISFETFRVLDISIFTFIGLFILAIHFATFTLLFDKFFTLFKPADQDRKLWIYVLAFALLTAAASFIQAGGPDPVMILIITLIAGSIYFIRGTGRMQVSYSSFVLLIFLFSVLSVYQISKYTSERRHNEKTVLAVDLSAEHDPVAELLLKNIEPGLAGDQELAYLIHEGYIDHMVIDDYLRGNYFGGFWDKYEMHYQLCSPEDSLYVEPYDDIWYPCYDFFDNLYAEYRFRIPGSRFYFVDNMSGRISYYADFKYYSADSSSEATLFLELDSRLVTEELGYPELLLRDRPRKGYFRRDYTYAKYSNAELITQTGDFTYPLRPDGFRTGEEEFEYSVSEGHEHLAYNLDEFNTIVVSSPRVSLLNLAITFTYIFVFFYLLLTVNLLVVNIPFLRRSLQLNIKNKIQYTMIGVLLLSLLLIGGGTIFFSIRQYKERHFDILSEKIQSVYIELMHKLEFENDLSQGWSAGGYANLDELLQKFSNVFFTDINLYHPDGSLLASSRLEVFDNHLTGRMIHPEAFSALATRNVAEFVHEESIGKLNYLSAYVPFRNYENELLAYLNLPYFTRQQIMTTEISNLVVAVVNFYVLLITISILIAVFISGQITQPLRMLQSKFGQITFGKGNEKIQYEASDEIGVLVREYNHMIDELATSAEKLAKSERESAWREMAKQIAHEIKNPLTPMKLSVQHLQRSYEKDPGDQKKNIDRITRTLIDQIDHLSTIATEFSNFAKMPRANNEEVDLANQLERIAGLFLSTEEVEIDTEIETGSPVIIFADPEQVTRVFMNLLKNAIQS